MSSRGGRPAAPLEPEAEDEVEPEPVADETSDPVVADEPEPEPLEPAPLADHVSATMEHAAGELAVPPGYAVLEGDAGRRAPRGRCCRGPLQRRGHHQAARVGARRARRSRSLARRGHGDAGSRGVRTAARGDGAREDPPFRLHRRTRLRDPWRYAAFRLRLERGRKRSPARCDRDRCSGRVRAVDARPSRPGTRAARAREPKLSAQASRWPTCSSICGPQRRVSLPDPVGATRMRRRAPVARILPSATIPSRVSKICSICGKKPGFGHNRSHSMVATKRRFNPNLQRVRMMLDGKATPRLRLHPLPQSRQGPESGVGARRMPRRRDRSSRRGSSLTLALDRLPSSTLAAWTSTAPARSPALLSATSRRTGSG